MNCDPYKVVRDFEQALCEYTGAKYAVTTNSCTMAILIACAFIKHKLGGSPRVIIPNKTYVSVPQSILHAGCEVKFRDVEWSGRYQLYPWDIWDYARRFTKAMYNANQVQCVSFHWSKILGIQQGGAILHDNQEADEWYRRARFDGRAEGVAPKDDHFNILGWHCYISPETAAQGLMRMSLLPDHNEDLPNDDYPDLSQMEIFK